jgi:hypothetical protein
MGVAVQGPFQGSCSTMSSIAICTKCSTGFERKIEIFGHDLARRFALDSELGQWPLNETHVGAAFRQRRLTTTLLGRLAFCSIPMVLRHFREQYELVGEFMSTTSRKERPWKG